MNFHIRAQEPADDEAVVTIFRETFPEFPHSSASDYRVVVNSWKRRGLEYRQYVAEADGRIVGCALVTPIESEEPALFYAEVNVRPDSRGQGIGSALFEQLASHGDELGFERVLGWIEENDLEAKAFAEAHGFAPYGPSEQQSRLYVPAANMAGFEGVEQTLADGGIRIELLEGYLADEDFMRRLHRVDMQSPRDVPSSVPWKDLAFEDWRDFAVLGPGRSGQWAWVALDGPVPVGLARLRLFQDHKANNAYTGVLASHRGRGIARALKCRTVRWCRDNGIEYIYTGNEVRNTRMLAINRSLGYEPLPKAIEVERRFSQTP